MKISCLLLLVLLAMALPPGSSHLLAGSVQTTGSVNPSPAVSPDWNVGGQLFVGDTAFGTLTIADGGTVSSTIGTVGKLISAAGEVTVTGTGSLWQNSDNLHVASGAAGTLNITAGGTVSNVTGFVGQSVSNSGTVTVSGANSLWESSADLYVAYSGGGTLTVQSGGKVTSASGYIGYNNDITGSVTVKDAGSLWQNSSSLYIGYFGFSSLFIQNGGHVSNTSGIIGGNGASTGSVTVSGSGSLWENSTSLKVGDLGSGTLTISDGASVSVNNGSSALAVANQTGSTGTLNIGSFALNSEAGTVTASSVTLGPGNGTINFNQTNNISFGTPITGSGKLVQRGDGTTTLTAANSYTGATRITDGTLAIGASGSLTGTSGIDIGLTGTFDVSALTSSFILGSSQTLSGKGAVVGNIIVNGTISPGTSPGLLEFDNNLTLGGTAVSEIEIEGLARGTEYDGMDILGSIVFGGELRITFLNGFDPEIGDEFQLFQFSGPSSGTFANITFSEPGYAANFNYMTGALEFIPVPEPSVAALLLLGALAGTIVSRRKTASR